MLAVPIFADLFAETGWTKNDIDFWCSGSSDYLAGRAFSFISAIDSIGRSSASWAISRLGRRIWISPIDPDVYARQGVASLLEATKAIDAGFADAAHIKRL